MFKFHVYNRVSCHFADIDENSWQEILSNNGLNPVLLRDNRYSQIIHMVTAADGAEAFYTLEVN